jgi:hypothetical protein
MRSGTTIRDMNRRPTFLQCGRNLCTSLAVRAYTPVLSRVPGVLSKPPRHPGLGRRHHYSQRTSETLAGSRKRIGRSQAKRWTLCRMLVIKRVGRNRNTEMLAWAPGDHQAPTAFYQRGNFVDPQHQERVIGLCQNPYYLVTTEWR